MMISAFPSMICAKVSKGDIFSVKPSPTSKDMTLILPVDFFRIVLITTALGTYSMISTVMCAIDFSNSEKTKNIRLMTGLELAELILDVGIEGFQDY